MDKFRDKRVVILGLARQGVALAGYLAGQGARVTVSDARTEEALRPAREQLAELTIEYSLGGHPLTLLDEADMLCLSGAVPADLPIVAEARRRRITISNDSQIFLEVTPARVVGITGSAGKTTTTTLVGKMMASTSTPKTGEEVEQLWVGGNIGNPLIADVASMRPGDWAVMELSSFQLEVMTRSPNVAAVLNITPNHLDRHGTMEAYSAAKANILRFQSRDDIAVIGLDDAGARPLESLVRGGLWHFGFGAIPGDGAFLRDESVVLRRDRVEREICRRAEIRLRGDHNVLNVLAACAIAGAAGTSPEAMRQTVLGFTGVPHRLELVREVNGARWYNDSIATAPERAIAALRSFDEPLVLLAGGRDKKLPWGEFAERVRARVDHLILFGEAAPMIRRVLGPVESGERPYTVSVAADLAEAVRKAARAAEPGDVVLLSPGGTSFDEFVDFAARGEAFKKLVEAL